MDVEGFIKFCAGLGVDGVDITDYYWKDREAEIKKIPAWLKENKISIAVFAIGNKFTTSSDEEMNKQIDYVKRGVDTALRLNTDIVRIFGGTHEELSREESLKKVRIGLEKCLPYAEKNKVILALENHGDLPGLSSEILAIIKEFKSKYLKCTLDIANFMFDNMTKTEDPVEATKNLLEYVVHVHAKDMKYDKDNHTIPAVAGEGVVNNKECFRLLKDHNYKGYLSLEYEDETIDVVEGVKKSISFFKKTLKQIS
jgi:sugar phosphate isomerase/epimerase